MAPAPPGNEFSDWLAPPRPATFLPRDPPLPSAPAQNPAGGPKSAKSPLLGGGNGICGQLESPRNDPSGWLLSGRRKWRGSPLRPALFSLPVSEFHAAFLLSLCQMGYSSPRLPVCPVASDPARRFQVPYPNSPLFRLVPLSVPLSSVPASSAFLLGWREPSQHARAYWATRDYISQWAGRPAPPLWSGDQVA